MTNAEVLHQEFNVNTIFAANNRNPLSLNTSQFSVWLARKPHQSRFSLVSDKTPAETVGGKAKVICN